MDKHHENRNTMYKAVDQFFIDRQPIAPVIPALTRKIAVFHGLVLAIEAKNGEYISSSKGKTQDKADAQEAMLDVLFRIASNLRSIATEKNDQATLQLTSISYTAIAKMRDTEQKSYAETIYKIAMTNAAALADFGVDDAALTDFKARIDTFGTKLGEREAAPGNQSAVRTSMFDLFIEADAALDDMDNTMVSYKTSDPEFYNAYCLLRPVKATGVRHKHPPQPTNTPQAAPAK